MLDVAPLYSRITWFIQLIFFAFPAFHFAVYREFLQVQVLGLASNVSKVS